MLVFYDLLFTNLIDGLTFKIQLKQPLRARFQKISISVTTLETRIFKVLPLKNNNYPGLGSGTFVHEKQQQQ